VDDLERIWNRVVVTFQRAEGGQNLVVDAFHQHYFFERVETMDLSVQSTVAELWLGQVGKKFRVETYCILNCVILLPYLLTIFEDQRASGIAGKSLGTEGT